jgi:hypothetical protein
MKKVILITLAVLTIIGVGAYGVFNFLDKETVSVTEKSKTPTEVQPDGGTFIEIQEQKTEPIEEQLPAGMAEERIQSVIHMMSHQKIEAEDKWGFIPLTAERVKRLIEVVNANDYRHSGLYLDILNRWNESNFSQADKDHNAVWYLQNGSIGKASGLLTIEEEQQLIEEYYQVEN